MKVAIEYALFLELISAAAQAQGYLGGGSPTAKMLGTRLESAAKAAIEDSETEQEKAVRP